MKNASLKEYKFCLKSKILPEHQEVFFVLNSKMKKKMQCSDIQTLNLFREKIAKRNKKKVKTWQTSPVGKGQKSR